MAASADFSAAVAAGTLRETVRADATLHSSRVGGDVAVQAEFTGGHMLHVAIASCVLNDLYREAAPRGVQLDGVCVTASGGFDPATAESTGIQYVVEVVDTPTVESEITRLTGSGLIAEEEMNSTCCFATQNKAWVSGPGGERWEVYTVLADSQTFFSEDEEASACACSTDAETGCC